MPRHNSNETNTVTGSKPAPVFRVMLVDPAQQVAAALTEAIGGEGMQIMHVPDVATARDALKQQRIDLVMLDPALPDGNGLSFADEIHQHHPTAQTIVVTDEPNLQDAIEAIRAGAADLLIKPLNVADLNKRVHAALSRGRRDAKQWKRIQKLRRICKKLSRAHEEVTQQVDVLCNDLVTAYQELAEQMHKVAETRDFTHALRNELDLEQVLRKTLEHLLTKAGPTNAAVFLPTTADEFTLGGYVNYDCSGDSADILLQHLASIVAPRLREEQDPVYLTDDAMLEQWFGDDWNYLADSHLLGMTCRHKGEPLAVVVLFRDSSEPFGDDMPAHLESIAPLLAEYLAKVIRVHHRALPGIGDTDSDPIYG